MSMMMLKEDDVANKKPLLPVKTKYGILRRYTFEKDEIGNVCIKKINIFC